MQKIFKKSIEKTQGLTLIEMLVAIFVFSITIATSMAVAATYFKGSFAIKKYQENSEELSLALNYISKDIRMSNTLVSTTGKNTEITLKSNANETSFNYEFANEELKKGSDVIVSNVTGYFYVNNINSIPLVTIVIWKSNFLNFPVQTTVSMRSGYQ